jgi:hypothetical protein
MSTADSESLAAATNRRPYGRWLGLLAGCVVAVAVIALISLGIREHRKARHLGDCRNHLRRIGAALHAYHDVYSSFPPAYVKGPDGARWNSWRVLLLPFLGQEELYRQYKLGEPWNSPHNRALGQKTPDVYSCAMAGGTDRGITTYLGVVGRATAWPDQYCSKVDDFRDGMSTTIQLVECATSDVVWTEPRDLTHQEAMKFDQLASERIPASAHQSGEAFLALMGDGTVRSLNIRISRDMFRSLLSINAGVPLTGVDWPLDAIPDVAKLPPPRTASDFPRTDVWPHPDAPIVRGRNYVYCATFAIAWQAACDQFGGRPLRLDGDPPVAQALNEHVFLRSNLADESYVAAAGRGVAAFRNQVQADVTRKSPNATPKLINPDNRDHAIQLYAYLQKSLPFHIAFDAIEKPLQFRAGGKPEAVARFGALGLRDDSRAEQLRSQVSILDYVNDDDFILSLKPAPARDVIVLAKVTPGKTLGSTIAAVRSRIAKPDPQHKDPHFLATESLALPKLTLSVEREYNEIVGPDIIIIGTDLFISGARQIIKFRLDETGAVIESEAVIIGDNGHTPHIPAGNRNFIFDRPFLIYLIERDADQPYFAAWIENTEFMDPVGR